MFDAARWPAREVVGRILGGLIMVAFVVGRILRIPNSVGLLSDVRWPEALYGAVSTLPKWLVPPARDLDAYYARYGYSHDQVTVLWSLSLALWVLITGSYLAYLVAYLTRARAQSVARGFVETVFPVLVAVLPFLTLLTEPTYQEWFPAQTETHMTGMYVILSLLIAGGAIQLTALLALRRGFTIMSEARVLIRSGIYRWIRHPVYASHFVMYLCYTLFYFHVVTVFLYVVFVAGQTVRARIEERKLAAAFPEYEEYRRTTGMFFPKLGGGGPKKHRDESGSGVQG